MPKRTLRIISGILAVLLLLVVVSQTVWSHRRGYFAPAYPKTELLPILTAPSRTPEDYNTLLRQTGLGAAAVETLLGQGQQGIRRVLQYQNDFFAPSTARCAPMLGWFTRRDVRTDDEGGVIRGPAFADLRPGDIIVSLSTHSLGWRHGHAGLVLSETEVAESTVLGVPSSVRAAEDWREFSNYAVLRVRDVPAGVASAAAQYAREHLVGVPYRLTAGWFGPKAGNAADPDFGAQCAYLVWYAWQQQGVDLDSDGGSLVTPLDILLSPKLEIVQISGMDPDLFIRSEK